MRGLFSRVPRIWSLSILTTAIVQLHAISALGSLYPTKPTASTVLLAGQAAQLEWVEDGHAPIMSELGHIKIQLFAGNTVSVRTRQHKQELALTPTSDVHCDCRSLCQPALVINNSLHTYIRSHKFSRLVRTTFPAVIPFCISLFSDVVSLAPSDSSPLVTHETQFTPFPLQFSPVLTFCHLLVSLLLQFLRFQPTLLEWTHLRSLASLGLSLLCLILLASIYHHSREAALVPL